MENILFIINQKSGTNRRKAPEKTIAAKINKTKYDYNIAYTQYAGHAVELAATAAKNGTSIIVAIGGDGSVNDVANGIYGTDAALAVIPQGSGNGLARALGITRNLAKAIDIINQGNVRYIDVGFANGKLFLSNAGAGFDAYIAKRFAKNKGRGLFNYARLVISAFKKFKGREYLLKIDGKPYLEKAFFIAVANGNQFGYDFKIAPDARLDDGQLDICVMKPLRVIDLPAVSLRSLLGNFTNSKLTKHYKGREIFISEAGMKWMQLDGDPVDIRERNSMSIELKHKAMKVIV